MNNKRIILLLSFLAMISAIVVAWMWLRTMTIPTSAGTYPVDPIFRAYYDDLGGAATIGPAISRVFAHEQMIYQYTATALMRYDNTPGAGNPYSLAPIGRDLGIFEIPHPDSQSLPGEIQDGQLIFEPFIPIYKRLGGADVVGKPLSGAHQHAVLGRTEQYFENAGFYWLEGADTEVRLLAYGSWKCADRCEYKPVESSLVTQPYRQAPAFIRAAARLGLDFTGFSLTAPYLTSDGQLMQIYENVIMVMQEQTDENVSLYPLPLEMGLAETPLENPVPGPGMTFYPVGGQLGFNVPDYYTGYLESHGGISFAGQPITSLTQTEPGYYRQCFANLCLEAQLSPDGTAQVNPIPLGVEYRADYHNPEKIQTGELPASNLTMRAWVRYPVISPDQIQVVGVAVLANELPVSQIIPKLTLTSPEGSEQVYQMDPTDENGESILELATLPGGSGTLVPYKVCITTTEEVLFCLADSFLIWQTNAMTVSTSLPPGQTSYIPFIMRHIDLYTPIFIDGIESSLPFVPR